MFCYVILRITISLKFTDEQYVNYKTLSINNKINYDNIEKHFIL